MIVRNESRVIARALASAIPWIDTWLICDTGSTDGTQDIIREQLASIPGELHEVPWINFGHNRTQAIQLARTKADYLLILDAATWGAGFPYPADKLFIDKPVYTWRRLPRTTNLW